MNRRRFLLTTAGVLSAPWLAHAAPMVSTGTRLRLVDAHTGTVFDGAYRDAKGPIAHAMDELCLFLRDQHTGGVTNIDVGVIDFLTNLMAAVGQSSATVLSAYRSLQTNARLERTMFGVADNSQHLYGRALDVSFPAAKLGDAVIAARAMKRGGVGWYPRSGFIHIDTGPVRNWDLDQNGLGSLLFDGQRLRFNDKERSATRVRSAHFLPEMERSGRLLPVLEDSGRLLSGMEYSGDGHT
jgi:uncharacterized protein YcbK (DUF882 family)